MYLKFVLTGVAKLMGGNCWSAITFHV